MSIDVGILGATGYTGAELLRVLINHPQARVSLLSSEKFSGQEISRVFPQFGGYLENKCLSVSELSFNSGPDLVFSCLPHGLSSRFAAKFLDAGTRVIDLSHDFRLGNSDNSYNPVYGLPELFRKNIRDAALVANPGCYATSVILGLLPLAEKGYLSEGSVIADVVAGSSGAGRAPVLSGHYPEANESLSSEPESARDQEQEMELKLSEAAGSGVNVKFTPHRAPINRGILATIYCGLNQDIDPKELYKLYEGRFSEEPFVSLCAPGNYPSVKEVTYSNMCRLGLSSNGKKVVIVSALDNLGKGASGQAVQNMNIMFGYDENEGLEGPALYP